MQLVLLSKFVTYAFFIIWWWWCHTYIPQYSPRRIIDDIFLVSHTSWAGQDAQNRQISLCSAQVFVFGPEILTLNLEQARQDTTWRAQNKKWKSVDFSSISLSWKTFSWPYVGGFYFLFFELAKYCFGGLGPKSHVKISGPNFKKWEVHGQVSTEVPLHTNLHIIQGFIHNFRTKVTHEMKSMCPYSSSQDVHAQKN